MSGMFSAFVNGASQRGADLYGQQALDSMRAQVDLDKTSRIQEMQAAMQERLRAATADRIKGYSAPITTDVPAQPPVTPKDDDNNDNPYTAGYSKTTAPTTEEVAKAALNAGDLPAAGMINQMSYREDRASAMQDKVNATREIAAAKNAAAEVIAARKDETTRDIKLDADGNPVAKGPGSGVFMTRLNSLRDDIKTNDHRVDLGQKELEKIDHDLGMSDTDKRRKTTQLSTKINTLLDENKSLRNRRDSMVESYLTPVNSAAPETSSLANPLVNTPNKIISPIDALNEFKNRNK